MKHTGSCHCGNLRLEFESALDPAEMEVRACQCGFCRKHAARAMADPQGLLTVRVADESRLNRYVFGYRTAEYLICRDCGVYVAAATVGEESPRAIAIVNAMDHRQLFARAPLSVTYDSETRTERVERRRDRWMPVVVEVAAAAGAD